MANKFNKHICYAVMVLMFMSCAGYHPHVIIYSNKPAGDAVLQQNGALDASIYNWKRSANAIPGTIKVTKYFAEIKARGPVSYINHKAIGYALKERYFEAEIIFNEALEEAPAAPELYNNLGVVYEALGRYDKAFEMYSRACLLDDRNEYFRKNFISFDENKKK